MGVCIYVCMNGLMYVWMNGRMNDYHTQFPNSSVHEINLSYLFKFIDSLMQRLFALSYRGKVEEMRGLYLHAVLDTYRLVHLLFQGKITVSMIAPRL